MTKKWNVVLRCAVTVGLVSAVLSGCAFKSPMDPNIGVGSGDLAVNTGDRTTTAIEATHSQVSTQGVFLSVRDQEGNALGSNWFNSGNLQVAYNDTVIPAGSITVTTASGSGQSISSSLVLDYSGSMSSQNVMDMETGATSFVNNMQSADRGEVIKFASDVHVVQGYTSDKSALRSAITATTTDRGSTSLYDGIEQGLQDTRNESGQLAIVAFTDGGDNDSVATQTSIIANARSFGIPIFTVGLGSASTSSLQSIATQTNGQYYYAPDSAQLAAIYQQIANIFNNTLIISWPSFSPVSGDRIVVTVTYVTASDSFTTSVVITIP